MGQMLDDPGLAALTLTRIAAVETQGPGQLTGRMLDFLTDLEQRNGADYIKTLAIALARAHVKTIDALSRAANTEPRLLLDAAETEALGE